MSTKKTNTINIPEARAAMDKFKMEAANDRGVFSPQKITNKYHKLSTGTAHLHISRPDHSRSLPPAGNAPPRRPLPLALCPLLRRRINKKPKQYLFRHPVSKKRSPRIFSSS